MPQDSINYADAEPQMRSKLDVFLEGIDRNPDSAEVVQAYGAAQMSLMNAVMDDLKKFAAGDAGGEGRAREEQTLRAAFAEAAEGVRMVLGAGREGLRRYNEEYIPEAERSFDMSRDPEDELFLKDALRRKEELTDLLADARIPELPRIFARDIAAAEHFRQHVEAGLPLEQPITVRRPLKLAASQP